MKDTFFIVVLFGIAANPLHAVITSDEVGSHVTTAGEPVFGINIDGVALLAVQFPDFLLLSSNFGKSATAVTAAPEPNAALLLLVGTVGLLRRRWFGNRSLTTSATGRIKPATA